MGRIRQWLERFIEADQPTSWEDLIVTCPKHYKTKSMKCQDIISVMTEGLTREESAEMTEIVKRLYRFKSVKGEEDLKDIEEHLSLLKEAYARGEKGLALCPECGHVLDIKRMVCPYCNEFLLGFAK